MPYANDGEVRLWYQVKGEGEPLVLTGGFGLLHNQFDYIADALALELRVINWNYRGAGLSDRTWVGGYSLDRWVDDLALILDRLKVDRTHLWGTSTGSSITLRFAARYPDRVRSVITYPLFKADTAFRKAFQSFLDIAETFGYEALARLTSWIGCADHNAFSQVGNDVALFEIKAFKRNFTIESLPKTLEMFSHLDLTGDLEKITAPALLLVGDSGMLGSKQPSVAALIKEFRSHCRHTRVAIMKNAGGTYCMIEKPLETAQEVLRFIHSMSKS